MSWTEREWLCWSIEVNTVELDTPRVTTVDTERCWRKAIDGLSGVSVTLEGYVLGSTDPI